MADTPLTNGALAARLDQSIEDFKTFVEQRFDAHEKSEGAVSAMQAAAAVQRDAALHLLLQEWRTADKRLLDERFETQTTSLQTALTAQQTALATALNKADETERRTGAAIKAIDDRQREGSGRSVGRADVVAWGIAALMAALALAAFLQR